MPEIYKGNARIHKLVSDGLNGNAGWKDVCNMVVGGITSGWVIVLGL
jgi:hypothetical protein